MKTIKEVLNRCIDIAFYDHCSVESYKIKSDA